MSETPLGVSIWLGEGVLVVGLAASYASVTWWLDVIRKLVDARRVTINGEALLLFSRLIALILLVMSIYWWGLSVAGYLVYQIISLILAIVLLTFLLRSSFRGLRRQKLSQLNGSYIRDLWGFSHPLFATSLVGIVVGIGDRWVLQSQSGSIEQGFFGLASQVAAVCFVFSSSMTQLLSREFSVAWGLRDTERMSSLFRRIVPFLFSITAYFSIFISYHAEDIIWFLGGEAWEKGGLVMAIMALYPMHQTYGQLSGSIFYATEKTRLYRNINIIGMVVGFLLMLFLVLPPDSGGLGLGAIGLALEMVLIQFIGVNIGLWFNTQLLSLRFWRLLAHQFILPIALLVCVYIGTSFASSLGLNRVPEFLLSGIAYTLLAGLVVLAVPCLAGLDRDEVWRFIGKLR